MTQSLRFLSLSAFLLPLALIGCSSTGVDGAATGGLNDGSGGTSSGTGGDIGTGGGVGTGGASSSGGAIGSGGTSASGGAVGTGGANAAERCAAASLQWKSGKKTNYESYPDPGSEECIKYNGCMWAGQFAQCNGVKSEAWVESHNIAAMFPDDGYELHDICIRSGDTMMVVTVYDTCGDSDCDGCCTENKGSADALIDLEKFTNQRWGLQDGMLEWADLGPTTSGGCD